MEERLGEAFELDMQLTVVGPQLQPGAQAPGFELEHFAPHSGTMEIVRLADSAGRVRLLNIVNSLDTPVCHIETRHWETLRADLPADVALYTISMDLPYAQARWQQAEGVTHLPLSAHQNEQFGRAYGVLLTEWRLLQRAVFVIDRDDRLTYVEYVADQMREPDYARAIEAVHQAAAR